ncbi:hypothetical protein OJAV_G00219710 [Oryzias javanicus]|uniref:Uncharacterized protein n=1 Tax=Oryzias javanicus TaxID=123683 RepID=A0A437C0L1_ORYJA|nr:hypothetical protein OJAV_G00219710 [Oryzias javanicus]
MLYALLHVDQLLLPRPVPVNTLIMTTCPPDQTESESSCRFLSRSERMFSLLNWRTWEADFAVLTSLPDVSLWTL